MIPKPLLARMRSLLGEEFPSFLDALNAPDTHALRTNTVKIAPEALLPLLPFTPEELPFLKGAFLIPEGERAGSHPLHHAGAYYMQDPSAMATVAALPFPIDGWRVLDLCAAPGGKTTQLAAAVGNGGIVVSNEIVRNRAQALLSNVERMGLTNTVVMNTDPAGIASLFDRYFDLVVVDAPCSGEGMLRKYPSAAAEWSEEGVRAAATRARLILEDAVRTVREGGYLLFSTCTFSEEENEETVTAFLAAHPDFSLCPVAPAVAAVTADGIHRAGRPEDIGLARRFYPHLSPGEGQFLALMQRTSGGVGGLTYREGGRRNERGSSATLTESAVRAAVSEVIDLPEGRLFAAGESIFLLPDLPLPPHGLLRSGVALGTLTGRLYVPHHHAASALGKRFRYRFSFSVKDALLSEYLRGAEIPAPAALRGFTAILVEGVPLGLAKCSQCRAKNHYPKGLRMV